MILKLWMCQLQAVNSTANPIGAVFQTLLNLL